MPEFMFMALTKCCASGIVLWLEHTHIVCLALFIITDIIYDIQNIQVPTHNFDMAFIHYKEIQLA